MLNSNFSIPKGQTRVYEVLKPGIYQCELNDVEERDGTSFTGQPEKQLAFIFVILKEGEYYGRKLWWNANKKFVGGTKPSNLYVIVEALTGKVYTKEESKTSNEWLNADFLNALVGKQQLLAVSQKPKQNGEMKNVIDSILPVETNLPTFDPEKMPKEE